MIKIDLHMHSGEDPYDGLRYPATALLDKAAALGFGAIAITLHSKVLEDERVFDYARQKGVLLIRAVEWHLQGSDVLMYNVTQRDVEPLETYDDIRAFRRERGDDVLIIAPHPFYPIPASIRHDLEENIDLFDAVEQAHLHFPWLDFNKRAIHLGRKHSKPIVANSDAHGLWMFGDHYTMIDAEPTVPSIFRAIRDGRLQCHSPHVSLWHGLRFVVLDHFQRNRRGVTVESFNGETKFQA